MAVQDDLRAVAKKLEDGSDAARFVASELRLVEAGCTRAAATLEAGDYLATVMWERLAVEATLRISWLAGDSLEEDESHELIVHREEILTRCERLRARDALNLWAAYKAITKAGGHSIDSTLMEGMTQLSSSRSVDPAPRSLNELAVNRTQRAIYAQHRLCSAVVHPGELIGDAKALRLASRHPDQIAVLAVVFSRAILQSLTP